MEQLVVMTYNITVYCIITKSKTITRNGYFTLFGNLRILHFSIICFRLLSVYYQTISADVIKRKGLELKSLKMGKMGNIVHMKVAHYQEIGGVIKSPQCIRKDMQQIILLIYKLP